MLADVANLQLLVVGLILLWAGTWKVFFTSSKEIALRSALALLFHREKTVRAVYQLAGLIELSVGSLLLLPQYHKWEVALAIGLTLVFVIYLAFSMKVAPERPCGCLGGRSVGVSWRTLARAGLLLSLSVLAWFGNSSWLTSVAGQPWLLVLGVLEALLLVLLSPDLGWNLKNVIVAVKRLLQTNSVLKLFAPLERHEAVQLLRESYPFHALSNCCLQKGPMESWHNNSWYFLTYNAIYEGRRATAVFAIPLSRHVENVHCVLVDESDGSTLFAIRPSTFERMPDHQTAELSSAPAS